ncbi:MAG: NAD(P)-binding domain-containing protein [Candidatus Pacebacteria bacterium]|nr:NAD(P)-binding domain-containing protein [Candidatus Paceibacterota bacterium]
MNNKKIGIVGSGDVGQALAKGFILDGYDVMVGSRDGHRAAAVDEALGMDVATGTFREVAEWAELVILAVKGSAAEGVAGELADALAGKVVIDVTNPISDDPPVDGVLKYFTSLDESLAERIQASAPAARVVKAWNTVSHRFMIDPDFSETPTMPIAGNDEYARKEVADIVQAFGWEVVDMGVLTAARAIEPLTMLLCIPGFLRNNWDHAFKLLRV